MKLNLFSQLLLAANAFTAIVCAGSLHQANSKDIAARLRARTFTHTHPNTNPNPNPNPVPQPPQASPVTPDKPGYCASRALSASQCCENVNWGSLGRRTTRKTSYNPVDDNCCRGSLVGTPVGCCPAAYSANKGHPKERGYCCASVKSCCASFDNNGNCLQPFDPSDHGFSRRDTLWKNAALTPREYVQAPLKSRALLNSTQGIEYVLGGGNFVFEGQEVHDAMHASFVKRAVTRALKYGQATLAHLGDYEIASRAKWILDPEWNPKQQLALSDSYKVNIADGHAIIDGILADPNFKSFQHYWFEVDRESLELIKSILPPAEPSA